MHYDKSLFHAYGYHSYSDFSSLSCCYLQGVNEKCVLFGLCRVYERFILGIQSFWPIVIHLKIILIHLTNDIINIVQVLCACILNIIFHFGSFAFCFQFSFSSLINLKQIPQSKRQIFQKKSNSGQEHVRGKIYAPLWEVGRLFIVPCDRVDDNQWIIAKK